MIHIFNSDLALEYINKVAIDSREEVYANICDYYVTKRSPYEIYDDSINKYNTTYSDLVKAISVLSKLETDTMIYNLLDDICKAITYNKSAISKPQITTLTKKLDDIVENKLPDNRNIKHQGYKILAGMKVSLLKKGAVSWGKYIEDSNLIPNRSDAIFVKSILLENVRFDKIANGSEIKLNLFEDVISSLNSLKIHYEFVQRVIDISEIMYNISKKKWKDIVNKAFNISTKLEEGSEIYASQKNIIDSMYRLDPSFAKELIKSVDKENTENKIGKLLHDYFETLEISNKIKNNQILVQKEKENYRMVVRAVLKAQRALNSEKIITKKISEVSSYLPIGNKLPLHEVFPIYMYYLSNCARTYRSKKLEGAVAHLHEENFRETVNATNLIQLLSQRKKFNEKSYRDFFIDEDFATNKAIKPNSREEAMSFIKNWMHDEVEDFIIIADSYFEKEDLEILKIIKELNENLEIDILGSNNGQKPNIEDDYKKYWKKISDELPPFTNITFCWVPEDNNNKPIHERWIITKNGGLRLGTSINSLGVKRESELSVMTPNEALNILENTLKDYINRKKREINNQRISYKSFSL